MYIVSSVKKLRGAVITSGIGCNRGLFNKFSRSRSCDESNLTAVTFTAFHGLPREFVDAPILIVKSTHLLRYLGAITETTGSSTFRGAVIISGSDGTVVQDVHD
jgi:hypothetical protein